MNTATSKSVAPAPVPEFDVVVLGRSFASQRAATRLRDEVRLSVHEIDTATSARYDDIDHRWEIRTGRNVVALGKFVIDGEGSALVEGRTGSTPHEGADGIMLPGFPNLFRLCSSGMRDPVGFVCLSVDHMRSNRLDYIEARRSASHEPYGDVTFDRPILSIALP